ncbi:MAG: S8 family serine peptidase [Phycisphaerales bacterium]|nr:S8 family serine peptidase [Phycisphaerales bacterium]
MIIAAGRRGLVVVALAAVVVGVPTGRAQPVDPIVPDEVMLRLAPDVSIQQFNAQYGTTTLRSLPSRHIHLVRTPTGTNSAALESQVRNTPGVVWAEANYLGDAPEGTARQFYFNIANDPAAFLAQPAFDQVNLAEARMIVGGEGVMVAVIDSGVDAGHPALQGRIAPGGYDFLLRAPTAPDIGDGLDTDGDGFVDEIVGHGTHVAALIAAVAPQATILPLRVLDGDGNTDNFTVGEAIFHALDAGAEVINLSLGSTYESKIVEDAVAEALSRGVVMVAAGGNNNALQPEFPAAIAGVISVAAVDGDDRKSSFSNFGASIALTAPGTAIRSAIPAAQYADWDGTSMAAPLVSGAAALVLERNAHWAANGLRAGQVRLLLQRSAADSVAQNPGLEGLLGAGRLDIGAAVQAQALFESAAPLHVGAGVSAIAAADVTGDRRVDVVAIRSAAPQLAVMAGRFLGGFDAPVFYPVGATPTDLLLADINGDGRPDAITVNSGAGSVSILIHSGSGFLPPQVHAVGQGPVGVQAADLDGDGDIDLAVVLEDAARVAILRNDGTSFALLNAGSAGTRPVAIAVADVAGSALPDVIVADRRGDRVMLLRNLGGGAFAAAVAIPVSPDPRAIAAFDVDGDGRADVVVGCQDNNSLDVLRSSAGVLTPAGSWQLPLGADPELIRVADVNCNGTPDIILSGSDNAALLMVLENKSRPGVIELGAPSIIASGVPVSGLVAADLDADGDTDFATSDSVSGAISVLVNLTCTPRLRGDLNCDGRLDYFDIDPLVVALVDPDAYHLLHPGCDLQRGDVDGDGAFTLFDIEPFLDLLFAGI